MLIVGDEMYCIGLTGNIASGKSTVAGCFGELGVDVISADVIGRRITQSGQPAFEKIIAHFGEHLISENGELDRRALRDIIFAKEAERQWLEDLLHPLIRQGIVDDISKCTSDYCIIEIPLIPNKEDYPYLSRILFVDAPQELKIERVMQRDKCSRDDALKILAVQADSESHKRNADDVLMNDKGVDDLRLEVQSLHEQYLSNAAAVNGSRTSCKW
jgi:dephospho-CoA kinase